MATIKVRLKSGFGDNGTGSMSRRMVLEINGQAVAATDPKTVASIAKANGSKNVAPHELKMNTVSMKGFEMKLGATNTAVLKSESGKAISKEVTFEDGAKIKLAVVKRGMLSKILTGKFYGIKAKVKA